MNAAEGRLDTPFYVANALVSASAVGLIAYLLFGRTHGPASALAYMPAVNASFNGLAAVLLFIGWRAIRRGARRAHRNLMISALLASALFFVGYLAYHSVHGDSHYAGTPWVRDVYLAILASHVLLSMAVVPLALAAVYFAASARFERHKKITRWLLPIWFYVSVTGVVIYLFLRSCGAVA